MFPLRRNRLELGGAARLTPAEKTGAKYTMSAHALPPSCPHACASPDWFLNQLQLEKVANESQTCDRELCNYPEGKTPSSTTEIFFKENGIEV